MWMNTKYRAGRRCYAGYTTKAAASAAASASSSASFVRKEQCRSAWTWLQRGRTKTAKREKLVPGTYVEMDDEWLIIDEHYEEHMRLKEYLLTSSHRPNVLCREEDVEMEEEETCVALEDGERHALRHVLQEMRGGSHVRVDEVDADGEPLIVERIIDGRRFNVSEFTSSGRALELCSLLAQEDFVLLRRAAAGAGAGGGAGAGDGSEEEEHIVCSACVCFSFGDLPKRIGLGLGAVHRAVDGYERHLSSPMNRLISSLRPGRRNRIARSNWDVKWSDSLVSHHLPEERGVEGDVADMYMKIEYQTLIRLDETHTLFSIRSFNEALTSISNCKGAANNLATNVRSIVYEEEHRAFTLYKELGNAATYGNLLEFLDKVTQQEQEQERQEGEEATEGVR